MSISTTLSQTEPQSFSEGPVKFQVLTYSIAQGQTSGTVTASNLQSLYHVVADGFLNQTAAATFSGNVATMAFTVPAGTLAARTTQGVTVTAVSYIGGNSITLGFTAGGTQGAEVVTVVGSAISVQIEDGVSTVDDVVTALGLSAEASALVTPSGSGITTIAAAAPLNLTGGIEGGCKGTLLCIGR